jgi:hypothetical protein
MNDKYMDKDRELFLQKLNGFIIDSKNVDKNKVRQTYLELVKEYHPDKNNEIDKSTLHEYMILINNIYNEIEKKNGNTEIKSKTENSHYFYINIFCQLFSKVKTICVNNETTNNPKYNEYRELFILEINKYSKDAGRAFSLLLSDEIINNKNSNIDIFIKGLAAYEQIFSNAYIYTEYYIKKVQRSALNYFHEYKKDTVDEIKEAMDVIEKWLNELISEIIK